MLPLVAQPVARWWPGTVDTPDANKLSKPGDGSRGHTQARDETINFNVAFPAPVSRKVATKPTRFVATFHHIDAGSSGYRTFHVAGRVTFWLSGAGKSVF